ncbi:DNA polymerase IV [Mycoplasmopsis anatis]|uniref:DNA polymerase IV n=1 Tax=Mycoplasmopsis anatis TaxID=171279 RepID=A0A9Q3L977_9BACT|nr:DNA polymerase IV [Mycoplasmopsis anatis]MBW0594858.1 DNA polymerase IV [Mycoplasmopsis anatis]MBW0595639.1 DNA polymerase IV [Mycoplasmopsis anatis]MBW0595985.1 DNA polymerase IV [Mycoplasmopsis anatis]MBW0596704.1 DNA polymerase IV [Mycoplasmopsis anatis]MBW0597363.1 DNA polymerase IV [Mycoplasmopsis anatis]
MNSSKFIFHIDFDSYFVSALRSIFPELKDKPVVIATKSSKAIISSASYELRTLGVKAGDSVATALKKEPRTIIVEPRYELFSALSNEIFRHLYINYTKKIDVGSIDEVYLDMSKIVNNKINAINLAKSIQKEILNKFKIPISVGISHTRFYAKMTTNLVKPFGVGFTGKNDIVKNFYSLDISKIFGIGKKSETKLKLLNINKLEDLANLDEQDPIVKSVIGQNGFKLISSIKGHELSEIEDFKSEIKGIGLERYIAETTDDKAFLEDKLNYFAWKISSKMQNRNLVTNNIVVGLRFENKTWFNKSIKLPNYTNEYKEILKHGKILLNEVFDEEKIVYGIRLRANDLLPSFNVSVKRNLFETDKESMAKSEVEKLVEDINFQLKGKFLLTGSELMENKKKKRHQLEFIGEDIEE